MEVINEIDTNTLRNWLEEGKNISVLDIRETQERQEWFIPGSIHFDAYVKLKANDPAALEGLHLDKTIPVVTVCAGGKTSLIAADLLQKQGYKVYSLAGGMKGWSLSWNTAKITMPDFEVIQFRRTGKGCLSYLVISGEEAILVDASLPLEAYQEILLQNNLRLKYVIETHIHADHLSRSKEIAAYNGVPLYLPVPNQVRFDFKPVDEATVFNVGNIVVTAIHTPGHTLESTCYLINSKVLLSGDTLFVDGVGRPDLKADHEVAKQKSKMLYRSLNRLLGLDEQIIVLPAHTSRPVDFDQAMIQSTIGFVKRNVEILKLNEEDFISAILQRIPQTPDNYLEIVAKNLKGDFSDINPVDLEAGANRCAIS